MKKSMFKRLVAHLRKQARGFSRVGQNVAGSKMAKWAKATSRRACDGTMRR
jgi:hypothetical protein